jgi:predicted nucleotidyltransferase
MSLRSVVLKELFASGARVAILDLVLLHPRERYYQRQIAQLKKLVVGSVQQEMPRLEKAGIVLREEDGNRVYYRVNMHCPIYPELKAIFLKASGVGQILRKYFTKKVGEIRVAFIYGSVAKGGEEAWSDIDLLVVGDIKSRALAEILYDAKKDLSRSVNHSHYSPAEFAKKVREKNPFVLDVLSGPKIFLVGDADELGKLAPK